MFSQLLIFIIKIKLICNILKLKKSLYSIEIYNINNIYRIYNINIINVLRNSHTILLFSDIFSFF